MKTLQKLKILTIAILIFCCASPVLQAQTVTVDGYVYLEDTTNHSGVEIIFNRTAPEPLISDTATTNSDGSFSILLDGGFYDVTYSKEGYFTEWLGNFNFYSNNTLINDTLIKHESTIHIPAVFSTIQEAIDRSFDGDTILVQPGTYVENINFNGKKIMLASLYLTTQDTSYISQTIIDGNQNGFVVVFETRENAASVLSGFTITNGQHGIQCNGGGGSNRPFPTLSNLIVSNNIDIGINFSSTYSSRPVLNNIIVSNNSRSGIRCHASDPILNNVIISNNSVSGVYGYGGGIYCSSSSPILNNVIISNNSAGGNGGGIYLSSSFPSLNNVTISDNRSSGYGGGIYSTGSSPVIKNSVISNNKGNYGFYNDYEDIFISFSNVSNNEGGNFYNCGYAGINVKLNVNGDSSDVYNNIQLNPQFIDAANGNYHLQSFSPCIGTGDTTSILAYDLDGNPRPNPAGSMPDMGAYEDTLGSPYVVGVANLDIGENEDLMHIISHIPNITFHYFNGDNLPQTRYQIQVSSFSDFATADMWDTGEIASSDTLVMYAGNPLRDSTIYYLRARASDTNTWGPWSTLTFRMNSLPSTPLLLSPINDEITAQSNPVLTVNNSTDAELDALSYNFYLATDSLFANTIDSSLNVTQGGSGTTTWQTTQTLNDNQQYFWRAKASDSFEDTEYSITASFYVNTVNTSPDPFNLLDPGNGSVVATLTPLLTWEKSTDSDPLDTIRYILYFDTPGPGEDEILTDTACSYQITTPLVDGSIYYWKVVAYDLFGNTTESTGAYRSFTVNTLPPTLSVTPDVIDIPNTSGSAEFYISNTGGGTLNWTCTEDATWFSIDKTNGIDTDTIIITYDANTGYARNDTITVTDNDGYNNPVKIVVNQEAGISVCPGDSAALMALYNATDGANWTNNTNWGSNQALNTWYGITTNADGCVTEINLNNNNLVDSIPIEIANLANLINLNLYSNQLSGSIPTSIGNLANLQELFFGHNQLSGSIPTEIGNLTNLEYLEFSNNQLSGSISPLIGNLTNLQYLNLNNNQLSGSISPSIGNLTNLTNLLLSNNQLTGSIPVEIGNLTNLTILYIDHNQLSSSMPAEIGNLTNLINSDFCGNQLSGSIPTEIGDLTNLRTLLINNNQLSGSIPTEIGDLVHLQELQLFNNQLSGSIPTSIGNLSNLQGLYLTNNQLTGAIPTSIGNLTNLQYLYLNNNLFGLENCPLIQSLIARGGWSGFSHSPQSNGVDFNNCPHTAIFTNNQTVSIGSNFVLDVNTTELYASDNIISYQFNLAYDATKLQYIDKSLIGTIVAGGLVMIDEPTPGILNISYMRTTPLADSGSILKLEFNPLQIGESVLTITNFLYNNDIITDISNGVITAIGLYGDVDANTYVRAYDAALTLQYSVGLDPLPAIDPLPWENWRKIIANVDDVGDISAYDASLILQHSAGIITQFPVEGTKQTSSTADISITRSLTDNELLFTSTGDLFGLNISVSGITNVQLGTPVILDANMLLAKNITGSMYNIGLSTAYSPADNTVVMKIPFTCTSNGTATFNMMVNNDAVIKTIPLNCLPLSVTEANLDAITLFPNPTSERVYINSLEPVTIKVYDLLGKLILSTDNSKHNYVSLSEKGIYLFELINEDNTVYKKVIVQ